MTGLAPHADVSASTALPGTAPVKKGSTKGKSPRKASAIQRDAFKLMDQGLTNTAIRRRLGLHNAKVATLRTAFEASREVEVPGWVHPDNHAFYRELGRTPDALGGGEEAAAAWARRKQKAAR